MKRPGPVSLASRLFDNKQKQEPRMSEVEPLWGMRELMRYLGLSRTACDGFLKNCPDFPKLKIGSQWRFIPEDVKAYMRRKQVANQAG
jgi:predicted DNA-binding transcriptional regulator AlpA